MKSQATFRVLRAEDVRQCCNMSQAIEAMRGAFGKLAAGEATVPLRTNMTVSPQLQALVMPVAMQGSPTFGLKAVSLTEDNAARQLPRIHASVLLFDAVTGQPRSLIDGEFLTALRTGAGSGLATSLLADEAADRLVVFGAGRQAFTQVEAVAAVRRLKQVTVVSRQRGSGERFCNEIRSLGAWNVSWTSDASAAQSADIICTATSSTEPVLSARHLPPRCHINAIGSYRKDMCELEPETVGSMSIVVDQRAACTIEAGEIVQALERGILKDVSGIEELGELLEPSFLETRMRPPKRGRTLFKSVGNAVQDLAVAQFVWERAEQLGIGQLVEV